LGGYARIAGMEAGPEHPHLAEAAAYLAYFGSLSLEQAQRSSEKLGFNLEEALDELDEWGTLVRSRDASGSYRYQMPEATRGEQHYAKGAPRPLADAEAFINTERSMTYRALSWWKRMLVLVAGAAFNLIFAVLVFTAVMLFVGENVPTTIVDTVTEDSPAAAVGIEAGDRLLSVDGSAYDSWQGITGAITSYAPGDKVTLGYEHEGVEKSVEVTLAAAADDDRPIIGVTSRLEQRPIAISDAAATAFGFIGYVATAILQLFNPATFQDTIAQSSSVVGVSVEARNAAAAGFMPFIILTAALSISIGLMNLLPIPPLDGGKMLVETIQRLTRREIPARVINGISIVGLALLMVLFVVCTSQDVQRYFLGQ
jgi:regulator of sigma E protease